MRLSKRKSNELRTIKIETNVIENADGSCLIKAGNTHVLCTASIEENVPPFLRKSGLGWVTSEYGMLPRSTHSRMRREAKLGKQSGRTLEIQRLIGRSLRACVDQVLLGERQIIIDCDVLQADGGTRCASITGGWIALKQAVDVLLTNQLIKKSAITCNIAAISCGIYENQPILDLDYSEDSNIETDANFVMTNHSEIVEVQASAEKKPFTKLQLDELLNLAEKGIKELVEIQNSQF